MTRRGRGVGWLRLDWEDDGLYGLGFATAEDRLLQLELFSRLSTGRLAEVFGQALVASDRRFCIAGVGRHCQAAAAELPAEERSWLRSYARG